MERGEGPWLTEAVEVLASQAGAEAGPAIQRLLTSERWEVREAAVRALGQLRYEPASSGLEALKSDYVGRVRRAAIEALARLPSRRPGPRGATSAARRSPPAAARGRKEDHPPALC